MTASVTVRVPCTTANLGPGFDCFGLALSKYTQCTFAETTGGLTFRDVEERYCNEKNLAVIAYRRAMREMGLELNGLDTQIQTEIPIARGLGSSAALIAAGIKAANAMHGDKLCFGDMLRLATEIEGHPDNVAPALLGGLTASMTQDGTVFTEPCPLSSMWRFCVLIPDFPLSTAKARAVLPFQVSLQDAVFNASHAALTMQALRKGDKALLQAALRDRLHQPYRRGLIDEYDAVERAALDCGADAVCISGAGPTVLCITSERDIAGDMEERLKNTVHRWKAETLSVDYSGAKIMK